MPPVITKKTPAATASKQGSTPAKGPATKAAVAKAAAGAKTPAVKTAGKAAGKTPAPKTAALATPAAKTTAAKTPAAKTATAAKTTAAKTPAVKSPPAKTPAAKTPAATTPAMKSPAAKTPAAKPAAKAAPKTTPAKPGTPGAKKTDVAVKDAKATESPKPVKEVKEETPEEKAAREASDEKRKQFIPSDTHLTMDLRQVESERAVLVYNLGMADLNTADVRTTMDKAACSALFLEHDDSSGRAFLRFHSSAKAKEVEKQLSGLLPNAQVQQGMGADLTEDLNGLSEQLKQTIPQLTVKTDYQKNVHYGVLIKGEPLLPTTVTEELLRQCFPAAINVWIPVGRAPDPASGQFEQTARYAFVELGSSEVAEKTLEGFDVSKLGEGVLIANYDQLRDCTLNPWPAKLKPTEKKGLTDSARAMLFWQLEVQIEWVKHSLKYLKRYTHPSTTAKLKLKNQRKLIERIVNTLNGDKTERTTAKKTLPDTDAQKKVLSSVLEDVNKLCKEFDDAEKKRVGTKRPQSAAASTPPAKKLKTGPVTSSTPRQSSGAPVRGGVRSTIRPQRGGIMLNRARVNPLGPYRLMHQRIRGRPMISGASRMINRPGMVMNQGRPSQGNMNPGRPNQGNMNQGGPNQGNMNQGRPNQGSMNQGRLSQGNMNQGRPNQGSMNQGRLSQGNMNQGRLSQGNMNPGRLNQGNMNQGGPNQGNMNQGRLSQGNMNQGGPNQGNMNQGRLSQGNMNQGGPNQGNMNQGRLSQGNMNQGGPNQGNMNQGRLSQGNMNRGPMNNQGSNQGMMGSGPNQMSSRQADMDMPMNQMNRGMNRDNMGNRGGNQSGGRPLMQTPNLMSGGQSSSGRGIDLPMTNTSIRFDTSYPSTSNKPVSSLMGGDFNSGASNYSSPQENTLDLIRSLKEELKSVTKEVVEMRQEKQLGGMDLGGSGQMSNFSNMSGGNNMGSRGSMGSSGMGGMSSGMGTGMSSGMAGRSNMGAGSSAFSSGMGSGNSSFSSGMAGAGNMSRMSGGNDMSRMSGGNDMSRMNVGNRGSGMGGNRMRGGMNRSGPW